MRRWAFWAVVSAVVAAVILWFTVAPLRGVRNPIVVGILHSKTGPLAEAETPLIDAEVLALEEINAAGGILGRPVQWVVADGRSDASTFGLQAQRLVAVDKVRAIFGVYNSSCRKAVVPVVEENKNVLFYPAAYEGLEQSPNVVYTGGPANQQVTPAVSWCLAELKPKKTHFVGTDALWPRVVGALVQDALAAHGASPAREDYLLPGSTDASAIVKALEEEAPVVVFTALEGKAAGAFHARLAQAGVTPARTTVISFNLTEEDLRTLPPRDVAGHYAAWNYVQSIDRPENRAFIAAYKARFGQDRVTTDGVTTAYNSVKLWAQAVAEAGTDDNEELLKAVRRQSLDAPEGVVSVDADSLHDWRPFYLGRAGDDGQFEIVFTLAKPVQPVPFPRTRTKAEWVRFIDELNLRWGGRWSNPGRGTGPAPAG